MTTNPFIELQDIDPIVKAELIEIERRLEFLKNIKKNMMRKSEMKNETRQADGVDLRPVNVKNLRIGVLIVIACFIFGVSLIVWIADLLFPLN